jgi:Tfp pilus assembly protein PilP
MGEFVVNRKNLFPLYRYSCKKLIFTVVILTVLYLLMLSSLWAAESASDENTPAESEVAEDVFVYLLDNRPDPFVPFITEKATTTQAAVNVNMNEIVEDTSPLTGMQLFEPGQLKLVALVNRGGENIAMVEDFTGKGYILTEGIKIGRRGVITEIAPNVVRIEETAVTRAGKKIISEVVMTLKKEGDK